MKILGRREIFFKVSQIFQAQVFGLSVKVRKRARDFKNNRAFKAMDAGSSRKLKSCSGLPATSISL